MTDTLEVTYIHEQMRGAPVLSGTAGTLIDVLDAFLLTGWGLVTATSVAVAGGVATATLPSGSAFEEGAVIQVAGATPPELNGRARVLPGASSTKVEWATTAANGAATGTINIKYAPQGSWEKAFSGTNKAAYRSTDAAGTQFYLRIDDSGTTTCRARGYETMSDIDTGIGPFPTDAQISGGGYWHKSSGANATAVGYMLAADNRAIRVAISWGVSNQPNRNACVLRGFGDEAALSPDGDAYGCTIAVGSTATLGSSANYGAYTTMPDGASSIYVARSLSSVGSSVGARSVPYVGLEADVSGNGTTMGSCPSAADGELKVSRRYLTMRTSDYTPRDDIVGLLTLPQSSALSILARLNTIPGAGMLAGHRLIALTTSSLVVSVADNNSVSGIFLVDTTGPWR